MTVFAVLAVALAAIGIFAVTAYFVSQRTHELGIRAALGSTRRGLLMLILGRGLRLTAAGLLVGIAASVALARAAASLLEGVRPHDPIAFAAAAAPFALISTAACLIPAARASRVDPMVTLRRQ